MKRITPKAIAAGAAALLAAAAVAGCSGDDTASADGSKPTTLKFTFHAGEGTSTGQLWNWWMDEVEKQTGGSVKFERFWDGTLLKSEELIEGFKSGRADVTQMQPSAYGPEEFPVTAVAELPFLSPNFPAIGSAMASLAAEDGNPLAKEWNSKGVELMGWGTSASAPLIATKKVSRVEDIKGLRVRAIGRSGQVLKAAGAATPYLSVQEVYGSLDRGLIDGTMGIPFSFVGPMKFTEVAKHFNELKIGISSVNGFVMRSAAWEGLSDEQREQIREVSKQIPAKAAEIEKPFDETSCKAIKDAGGTITVLPEPEVERLSQQGTAAIEATWVKAAGKAGVSDPKALLAELRKRVQENESGEFADFKTAAETCLAS